MDTVSMTLKKKRKLQVDLSRKGWGRSIRRFQ